MLKGGAIISDPGGSCILYPNINNDKTLVSKVALKSTSDLELDATKYLRPHDPTELFGIYPKNDAFCSRPKIDQIMKKEGHCESYDRVQRDPCVYSIELYTHDLNTIPKESGASLLRALFHLWRGLVFLHDHKCVHSDIKEGNIAYRNKYSGQPKMFAFTDWGAAEYNLNEKSAITQLNYLTSEDNQYYFYDPKVSEKIANYWNPFLNDPASEAYSALQLVYANDVFSMALMQKRFIKECLKLNRITNSSKVDKILHLLNFIITKPEKCVEITARDMLILEPLYN